MVQNEVGLFPDKKSNKQQNCKEKKPLQYYLPFITFSSAPFPVTLMLLLIKCHLFFFFLECIYTKHFCLDGRQIHLEIYDPCSQVRILGDKKASFYLCEVKKGCKHSFCARNLFLHFLFCKTEILYLLWFRKCPPSHFMEETLKSFILFCKYFCILECLILINLSLFHIVYLNTAKNYRSIIQNS